MEFYFLLSRAFSKKMALIFVELTGERNLTGLFINLKFDLKKFKTRTFIKKFILPVSKTLIEKKLNRMNAILLFNKWDLVQEKKKKTDH